MAYIESGAITRGMKLGSRGGFNDGYDLTRLI